jgi:hypothetical protein
VIGAEHEYQYQNRNTRRIPMTCPVNLRIPETHETFQGFTLRLSVEDIAFETDYVPRQGQMLEITVTPPSAGVFPPLKALIQVFGCVAGSQKGRYEVAGRIKKILQ